MISPVWVETFNYIPQLGEQTGNSTSLFCFLRPDVGLQTFHWLMQRAGSPEYQIVIFFPDDDHPGDLKCTIPILSHFIHLSFAHKTFFYCLAVVKDENGSGKELKFLGCFSDRCLAYSPTVKHEYSKQFFFRAYQHQMVYSKQQRH